VRRPTIGILAVLVATVSLGSCGQSAPSHQTNQSRPEKLSIRAGYLAPWDARWAATIDQGKADNGALTELSPVFYQPDETGQVTFASAEAQSAASDIEQRASSHGFALMPSISNFRDGRWDSNLIHTLLTDSVARAAHIAAISTLAQSHPWAGVDLDYESLRSADRSAYSAFVRDLGGALHQAHKRLSVTVHAKTSEPGDWSGARAEDWRALGASADEIRVMAYDHSTEQTAPGPVAPLPWVELVVRFAASEIPREKILLGVGAYGYDWTNDHNGVSLQWADAERIAQQHSTVIMWDASSSSPWFTYTDSHSGRHSVWYENARSLQAKLDLARQYGVAGVFVWRLGGEDPAVWDALRQAG
jgi:spore germination protein